MRIAAIVSLTILAMLAASASQATAPRSGHVLAIGTQVQSAG
jgi:hypothetical protein